MVTFLTPVTIVSTCEINNDLSEYNALRAIKFLFLFFSVVIIFNPFNTTCYVHSLQTSNYQDREVVLLP